MIRNLILTAALSSSMALTAQADENWISLFNGENLDGWTVKFSGSKVGENYKNTFRVEDGKLVASYDEYDEFNGEYGHIFYKEKYSHYKIKLEYRFVGEQIKGAPNWAKRNNGIMFHTQSPESMEIDHGWPVSLEFQLLGGLNDGKERHTGNVCTPGTHITIHGKFEKEHCLDSTSKTYHGDQWVTAELEVKGDEYIRQYINGELVLEYFKPVADGNDGEQPAHPMKDGMPVTEGYIALQAESHPTEFRNIMLLDLSSD
ncbi:3-keto-disaccharide hydrolase [Pseudemcibacter aquimaris]|uniref:3-keto-disaccharide hydrolase n=1 Tax=Pseudemcibacter aquimaris TaxID=2857064 RepID=UPI0020128F6B|nr:DUF1080 domain-containing protein [Pseudemcibacter aquimaris]MCC3860361.1 DUF1080 domain-containing protein [Pseudemcibacter aquimaris]WDU57687.1 DUF1080 domain-containing protein [Pseudemcibacter aquimaris]